MTIIRCFCFRFVFAARSTFTLLQLARYQPLLGLGRPQSTQGTQISPATQLLRSNTSQLLHPSPEPPGTRSIVLCISRTTPSWRDASNRLRARTPPAGTASLLVMSALLELEPSLALATPRSPFLPVRSPCPVEMRHSCHTTGLQNQPRCRWHGLLTSSYLPLRLRSSMGTPPPRWTYIL